MVDEKSVGIKGKEDKKVTSSSRIKDIIKKLRKNTPALQSEEPGLKPSSPVSSQSKADISAATQIPEGSRGPTGKVFLRDAGDHTVNLGMGTVNMDIDQGKS